MTQLDGFVAFTAPTSWVVNEISGASVAVVWPCPESWERISWDGLLMLPAFSVTIPITALSTTSRALMSAAIPCAIPCSGAIVC